MGHSVVSSHQGQDPDPAREERPEEQRSRDRGSQRGEELLLCLTQSVTYPGIRACDTETETTHSRQ